MDFIGLLGREATWRQLPALYDVVRMSSFGIARLIDSRLRNEDRDKMSLGLVVDLLRLKKQFIEYSMIAGENTGNPVSYLQYLIIKEQWTYSKWRTSLVL